MGAYANDAAGIDAGAAYLVFAPFPSGQISLADVARYTAELPGDGAGRALAGVGDWDGDGASDLLVGAPYSDAGGAFSGSAYVLLPW